jgi:arginyl-tRNA synthetase
MKTIKEKTKRLIAQSLEDVVDCGSLFQRIELRTSANPDHGDFYTNICMQVSTKHGVDAVDLARRVKDYFEEHSNIFDEIGVSPEGHVNFHLNNKYFRGVFREIETGRFEAFERRGETKRFVVAVEKLSDIVCLCDLRAFLNMYTLSGLYDLAGYDVEKYILVKDDSCDLAISYFLTNFDRDIGPRCEGLMETEITKDAGVLEDAIVFISKKSEKSYPELKGKALVTEKVDLYDGDALVDCLDVGDVMEKADLERIRYSLVRTPYAKKAKLQYNENNSRNLQYVYSRTRSLLDIFKEDGSGVAYLADFDETLLVDEREKDIVREMSEYSNVVEKTVREMDPSIYIAYAERLSKLFNDINDNTLYRQLEKDKLKTILKLYRSLAMVFSSVLDQLEVNKSERM